MRGRTMIAAVAAAALATGAWTTERQSAEEAAVRAALQHYVQGHETGDGSHMRIAFHPDAKVMSVRDGKLASMTSEEYAGRFTGKPAADEAQRRRTIERVEVSGTAATGKIVLDYPATRFVDYMTLLKVDGQWKIVSKAFHAERK